MKTWLRTLLLTACVAPFACGCEAAPADLGESGSSSVVVGGEIVHRGQGVVTDAAIVRVPGSKIRIATWNETLNGATSPYYAFDLGAGWLEPKKTTYAVPLRTHTIDPRSEIASAKLEDDGENLHVVQFVSQPLQAFWTQIKAAGGEVEQYMHGNSQLVRANGKAVQLIAKMPFVRAVTPLPPLDRVDPTLLRRDDSVIPLNVVLVDAGKDRSAVEDRIKFLGGSIDVSDADGILIEARLAAKSIPELSSMPQVLWVEQAQAIENDYDISRQQGGADFLESLDDNNPELPGYTGVGIRGHILEGIDPNHPDFVANDFRSIPVGIDDVRPDAHGMQTFGIVFGSGAGNARARGILPNGQGFFTNNKVVIGSASAGRSLLVGKLISEHKVMFQTASWGDGLTKTYAAKSAEMDALILKHDMPITQSQSNSGSQSSRPQAWAKNIISVGALNHFGTLSLDDDKWSRSGSIGPAADGSIKPDLCFYYDKTITTTLGTGYSTSFGGTSGATPTVAGHVGLTVELWTDGVFGNPVTPRADGEDMASYRFKNRPHATTTKALLIHSAKQHQFEGETHDRTRVHQGWGLPDVASMYKRRSNMVVVNETDVLQNLQKKTYTLNVPAGAPDFRATMVYADKEASVPSTIHRVNNLDLKVTAPDGTVYWGNNGLKAAMTSTPGGEHNVLDTVENVFVNGPQAGRWTVEVIADEINADTHLESTDVDADYALVVSTGSL